MYIENLPFWGFYVPFAALSLAYAWLPFYEGFQCIHICRKKYLIKLQLGSSFLFPYWLQFFVLLSFSTSGITKYCKAAFTDTQLYLCTSLLLNTFQLLHELDCCSLRKWWAVCLFLGQKIPLCWFEFRSGSVSCGILWQVHHLCWLRFSKGSLLCLETPWSFLRWYF